MDGIKNILPPAPLIAVTPQVKRSGEDKKRFFPHNEGSKKGQESEADEESADPHPTEEHIAPRDREDKGRIINLQI
ncbi:MAG: hypothetical protein ACK4OO_03325 [bacterium]